MSDEIEFKLERFESLCAKSSPNESRQKDLQKCILEILTWVDDNLSKVSKEILFEILELIHKKQKIPEVKQAFSDYSICFHVNNNLAFFIQQRWKDQEEIQNNFQHLKSAIAITKSQIEDFEVTTEKDVLLKVKYLYSLINNYLQITACHSQMSNHHVALKNGRKCLKHFKHLSKLILNFIE